MAPRLIEIKCPYCKCWNNPIPADMGDKTKECRVCGIYIHYNHRTHEVKETKRPERATSSGLTFG